ncbi:MAG TPA: hypothetical protein VMB52_03150 [Verrucomicrobiae bacterium]|nr:hypothetical protein [Verrucomicrobiae bacterium]
MSGNAEASDGGYRGLEDHAFDIAEEVGGPQHDRTAGTAFAYADAVHALNVDMGFSANGGSRAFPSVQHRDAYRNEVEARRPPVYSSSRLDEGDTPAERDTFHRFMDPVVGLDGCTAPVGILERIEDVDFATGDSFSATWLACASLDEAAEYVGRVGATHSDEPGGDGQGEYTTRTIHANPWVVPDTPQE